MAFELTSEQRAAVENEGGQLLVSAAAGSGKTRVLVERLLRRVDAGEDVDRFLVITFTNAAAAELRGRIMDAILERVAADPSNLRLRRQAQLLGRAHIGTIHSFCGSVIRENAHRLRLPPDFRVCDEKEAGILKQSALADLLDELYDAGDPEFNALADEMGAGRDDSGLVNVILDTHVKLLSHPSPEKWAKEQLKALDLEDIADAGETVWGQVILERIHESAGYWASELRKVLHGTAGQEKFQKGYGRSIEVTLTGLNELYASAELGWDEARRALANVEFPRASGAPGFERDIANRNACRDAVRKLPELIWDSSEKALEDMRATAPVVRSLLRTVLEFDRRYSELKRKRGVLDFSDQEHMALRLLVDGETGKPTETAREIAGRFTEIMVDEYQDVNEIQEEIFGAVSREGNNIFMVGDVKQSIYRFRLADPTIFLRKYTSFPDAKGAEKGEPRKVVLSRNFRSSPGVLEAVNFVFENLMSPGLGDLEYGPGERLYPPEGVEDAGEPAVELDVLSVREPAVDGKKTDKKDADDDGDGGDKTVTEALFAARRIKEIVKNETLPDGQGGRRPVTWGDFAVLMRSPSLSAEVWQQVFAAEGVPLSSAQSTDFFSQEEVSLALSMLSVIDNPRQDIPLITVLRSPACGFSSQELAEIRLADKSGDFWQALNAAAKENAKCRDFLEKLQRLRELAPDLTADGLLWEVYTGTRLFAVVSAMPDGQGKRENLMLLLELARSCEGAGYRGLFGFMTWVRRLREQNAGPEVETRARDNSVRLMSIHRSKGLEFPIVILAGLSRRFSNEDARVRLPIHPQLGPGPKRTDVKRRIEYNTIARRAVSLKLRREMLSEELRILYVAMTRPRERLIMLASYADAFKGTEKLMNVSVPASPEVLGSMLTMADWLMVPALKRPESKEIRFGRACEMTGAGRAWDVRLITPKWFENQTGEIPREAGAETEEIKAPPELAERLEFVYPYAKAVNMPSKVTATELKGTAASEDAAQEAQSLTPRPEWADRDAESAAEDLPGSERNKTYGFIYPPEKPAFMGGRGGLTAAEKGTATHLFMQYADYSYCKDAAGVRRELERLMEKRLLSSEQARAVDPNVIARFFASLPGRLILGAEKLHRELKFSLLVNSEELPGFEAGEKVLLQGVVDCCVERGGKLTVIDFKTDRVTEKTIGERAEYYAGQLRTYALALRRMFGMPVERKILCFLTAGRFVETE